MLPKLFTISFVKKMAAGGLHTPKSLYHIFSRRHLPCTTFTRMALFTRISNPAICSLDAMDRSCLLISARHTILGCKHMHRWVKSQALLPTCHLNSGKAIQGATLTSMRSLSVFMNCWRVEHLLPTNLLSRCGTPI